MFPYPIDYILMVYKLWTLAKSRGFGQESKFIQYYTIFVFQNRAKTNISGNSLRMKTVHAQNA